MTYKEFKKFANKNEGKECLIKIALTGKREKAKIKYEKDDWYICSDSPTLAGTSCDDKLGFKYSWIVIYDHDMERIEDITLAEPFISEDDF